MKIYDLTHTISAEMPVYPGSEPLRISQSSTRSRNGFAEKKIIFHTHNGTHLDAPAHILEGTPHLDDLTLDRFVGRGMCIPVEGSYIDETALHPLEDAIARVDFILFATGWSKLWGTAQYFSGYPVLSEAAARYLKRYTLKGVGFDTISADREDSKTLPIHTLLLQDKIIIENLNNLDTLPESAFTFFCMPLKIAEADGSPTRAIAVYP
ncbi:MAG: cyclase family protein [Desulfopila sp.]|nr:cyclase family protein [Desulfopila sp.]